MNITPSTRSLRTTVGAVAAAAVLCLTMVGANGLTPTHQDAGKGHMVSAKDGSACC